MSNVGSPDHRHDRTPEREPIQINEIGSPSTSSVNTSAKCKAINGQHIIIKDNTSGDDEMSGKKNTPVAIAENTTPLKRKSSGEGSAMIIADRYEGTVKCTQTSTGASGEHDSTIKIMDDGAPPAKRIRRATHKVLTSNDKYLKFIQELFNGAGKPPIVVYDRKIYAGDRIYKLKAAPKNSPIYPAVNEKWFVCDKQNDLVVTHRSKVTKWLTIEEEGVMSCLGISESNSFLNLFRLQYNHPCPLPPVIFI